MFKNKELVAKFNMFLKSLKKEDKIALLFHSDADGVCSGVILAKAIEFLRGKKIDYYFSQGLEYPISEKTIETLKKGGYNKFIVTDQAVDSKIDSIKEIEKFADILIFDHHELINNVSSEKTTFIKVALLGSDFDGADYPASKLAYDMCKDIVGKEIERYDWIACVGLIGDTRFKQWKGFVNDTLKKYRYPIKETGPENVFGKIGAYINAAKTFDFNNLKLCFDVLYDAKDAKSVFDSKLKEFKSKIDEEMNKIIEGFSKVKEENGLYVYEIKPRFPMHSSISTILSMDYMPHNKTLIIIADNGDSGVYISARRQDRKSNMARFLLEAVSGFNGANAGGHVPAAGGTIQRKDIKKFKSKLMQLYKEHNGIF